jgi:hypothetical protein
MSRICRHNPRRHVWGLQWARQARHRTAVGFVSLSVSRAVWGVEVPVPAPSLQQLQRPGIGGKKVAGRQAAGTLSVEGQAKGPRRS